MAAKRVLYVTEAAGGGVRRHFRCLAPRLRERGWSVDILLGDRRSEPGMEGDLAAFAGMGCRSLRFGGRSSLASLVRGGLALRRAVRSWRPEVVHLHATRAGAFGRLAGLWRGRVPIVYSPHAFAFQGRPHSLAGGFLLWLERALRRRADLLVCVSRAEVDLAVRRVHWDPGAVRLAENGIEEDFRRHLLPPREARERWRLPESAVAVGFVGRLVPQKDPGVLLEAFARCAASGGAVFLVLCGAGPLEARLRRRASELGIAERVRWAGYVPEASRLLAGLDLLVLPSRYEGLSYALLEGLAAGVPMVAADVPGNCPREELREAVAYFPPGDVDALARVLGLGLADLTGWRERAGRIAGDIPGRFSCARQADVLAGIYDRLRTPCPAEAELAPRGGLK
ncbi:MAG: glycosyltransferase [Lentisphaeria bacterium]|nr:glycosyltransferase [Lentisphaeria bacterium]